MHDWEANREASPTEPAAGFCNLVQVRPAWLSLSIFVSGSRHAGVLLQARQLSWGRPLVTQQIRPAAAANQCTRVHDH